VTGDELAFRPLTRENFTLVAEWLDEPHVAQWWPDPHGPEDLETAYGPAIDGTDPTEVRIVTLAGAAVGLAQRYRLRDEPAWRATLAPTGVPLDAFGIDYLIGDAGRIGVGLGTRMVAAFVAASRYRYPEATACVVSVHRDNRRSSRALGRVGFVPVWEGELDSDDPSDDGPQVVLVLARPTHP